MNKEQPFAWPTDKRVAVSFSFDDARLSQVDVGVPILNGRGVRASFYVIARGVEARLDAWKAAVAAGHEIGNHTVNHPCSGNFAWSRARALEDYTLEKMEEEFVGANKQIVDLLGVTAKTFAYPCGLQFIGRGQNQKSYVPLVDKHFLAGRGFREEAANAPTYCDLAKIGAFNFDASPYEEVISRIQAGAKIGDWVVFAGHEVGESGGQTVNADLLDKVCAYCQDPANGVWIDTIQTIAQYVKTNRKQP
jgi:peptidoglycan-N-acetylglucosamine deacetylase